MEGLTGLAPPPTICVFELGEAVERRRPIAMVAALLVSAGLLQSSAPWTTAGAEEAGSAGTLVFASVRDGDFEVFSMAADGSAQRNLTREPLTADLDPAWSPGGTRIAFSRYLPGNPTAEIFVMEADGSQRVRLTRDLGVANDREPAWSPSGRLIAFTRAIPARGTSRIAVMRADGTRRRTLTNTPQRAYDASPAWSPAGDRIAFVSDRAGGFPEIWVMNAGGTQPTRLTWNRTVDANPAWSPDGTRIAFERCCPLGTAEIWVMNADGTGRVRLTTGPGNETQPTWSTDGSTIAFVSYPAGGGNRDVHTVNVDGTPGSVLTQGPMADVGPDWVRPVPPAPEPTPASEPSPSPSLDPSPLPDVAPAPEPSPTGESPSPDVSPSPEETVTPTAEGSPAGAGGFQDGGAVVPAVLPATGRRRYRVLESRRVLEGLRYRKILDRRGPNRIHVLRMDPALRPRLDVAVAGGDLAGAARTSQMAAAHGAVAAVNGDFGLYGRPVHPFAEDGILFQTSFARSHNVAVSHREDAAYFRRPTPRLAVLQTESGDVFRVDRWNRGEPTWGEVAGYTPAGEDVERPPSFACSVRLFPAGPLRWTAAEEGIGRDYLVDEAACRGRRMTRDGGVVLSAQPGSPEALLIRSLAPGERVTWTWTFGWTGVADTLGGYPLLLQRGDIVVGRCWASICARHPRTAIGVDAEGRMVLAVVDGRRRRSVGMDLVELARLMKRLGAVSALNLDGGGSSTMVVRRKIVNLPSDGRERYVSSAVLILDGADGDERIRQPAMVEPSRDGAPLPERRPGSRRGNIGGSEAPGGRRTSSLYDPGSTGGLLDAVDRGLFGAGELPLELRSLLRAVRSSGWREAGTSRARSTTPG
jgi:Tol biopolymer transport system component